MCPETQISWIPASLQHDGDSMNRFLVIIMLTCGFWLSANADIWKYVDAYGKSQFVDSNTPIYTWVDESGKRYYADVPEHEDAVSVQLVWHSTGNLANLQPGDSAQESGSNEADPEETPKERIEREQAEAYYCKRAQQIYDSYSNAPRLYKTSDDGNRVFLSDEEMETTLAETKARVDELCH